MSDASGAGPSGRGGRASGVQTPPRGGSGRGRRRVPVGVGGGPTAETPQLSAEEQDDLITAVAQGTPSDEQVDRLGQQLSDREFCRKYIRREELCRVRRENTKVACLRAALGIVCRQDPYYFMLDEWKPAMREILAGFDAPGGASQQGRGGRGRGAPPQAPPVGRAARARGNTAGRSSSGGSSGHIGPAQTGGDWDPTRRDSTALRGAPPATGAGTSQEPVTTERAAQADGTSPQQNLDVQFQQMDLEPRRRPTAASASVPTRREGTARPPAGSRQALRKIRMSFSKVCLARNS